MIKGNGWLLKRLSNALRFLGIESDDNGPVHHQHHHHHFFFNSTIIAYRKCYLNRVDNCATCSSAARGVNWTPHDEKVMK